MRFTTNQIGSTGDADLITLVNDKMSLAGTLEMSVNSAALTHSGDDEPGDLEHQRAHHDCWGVR